MSRASPPPPDRGRVSREVIFEFTRIGDQIRVAAVDSATGAEAIVFGPATAAQADLERLALNKLRYVMQGAAAGAVAAPPGRPGRLV